MNDRLRVLTWHVHGSYLWYLSHIPHDIYLPVESGDQPGYGGRSRSYDWPANVIEVPADEVPTLDLDVVVTQSKRNWTVDQPRLTGPRHQDVPRIHVEHDPPRSSPTDERHFVEDPDALVVHVTHFNQLMWDNDDLPTIVIEHGIRAFDDHTPTYAKPRGIVVVNNLRSRGRRLGADVFERIGRDVPLDLFGMGASEIGGVGELSHSRLQRELGRYRFFFNPIRYTSLGLAICEAMMSGLPVVGLATTELVTVIENGVNGYIDTDIRGLVPVMRELTEDSQLARELGLGARRTAERRFGLARFVEEWDRTLRGVVTEGAAAVATRHRDEAAALVR